MPNTYEFKFIHKVVKEFIGFAIFSFIMLFINSFKVSASINMNWIQVDDVLINGSGSGDIYDNFDINVDESRSHDRLPYFEIGFAMSPSSGNESLKSYNVSYCNLDNNYQCQNSLTVVSTFSFSTKTSDFVRFDASTISSFINRTGNYYIRITGSTNKGNSIYFGLSFYYEKDMYGPIISNIVLTSGYNSYISYPGYTNSNYVKLTVTLTDESGISSFSINPGEGADVIDVNFDPVVKKIEKTMYFYLPNSNKGSHEVYFLAMDIYGNWSMDNTSVILDSDKPIISDFIYENKSSPMSEIWSNNYNNYISISANDSYSGIGGYRFGYKDTKFLTSFEEADYYYNQGYVCQFAYSYIICEGMTWDKSVRTTENSYEGYYSSFPKDDGVFNVCVIAYDLSGNISDSICNTSLSYDGVSPTYSNEQILKLSNMSPIIENINGQNINSYYTNKIDYELKFDTLDSDSGTRKAELIVEYSDGSIEKTINSEPINSSNGTYYFDINETFLDKNDRRFFKLKLYDNAGNIITYTLNFVVTFDNTKPSIPSASLKGNDNAQPGYTNISDVYLSANLLDNFYVNKFLIYDDDLNVLCDRDIDNIKDITIDEIISLQTEIKEYVIKLRVIDLAGNENEKYLSIYYNNVAPELNDFYFISDAKFSRDWTNSLENNAKIIVGNHNVDIYNYSVKQKITKEMYIVDNSQVSNYTNRGFVCMNNIDGTSLCTLNGSKTVSLWQGNTNEFSMTSYLIDEGDAFNYIVSIMDKAGNITTKTFNRIHYDALAPTMNNFRIDKGNYIIEENTYYINKSSFNFVSNILDSSSGIDTIEFNLCEIDKDKCTKNTYSKNGENELNDISLSSNIPKEYYHLKIDAKLTDRAGNIRLYKNAFNIVYDTILPKLSYQLNMGNSTVSLLVEDENFYDDSLKNVDLNYAQYYISAYKVSDTSINNWIETSKNNTILFPYGKFYLYVAMNNDIYVDKAGNKLSMEDNGSYLTSFLINNFGTRAVNEVDSTIFPKNFIYIDDKTVSFVADNFDAEGYPLEKISNEFTLLNKKAEITGFDGVDFKIVGLDPNSKSQDRSERKPVGTYLYENVIIRDFNHNNIFSINLLFVPIRPIVTKFDDENVPTFKIINKGEEVPNLSVSFVSNISPNVNVVKTISLNGVKVDSIDTNIPGTYSIRTKATDIFNHSSYLDQTLIVRNSVSENKNKDGDHLILLDKDINSNEETMIHKVKNKERKNNNDLIKIISLFENKSINVLEGLLNSINVFDSKPKIFSFKLFSKYFFKIYDG